MRHDLHGVAIRSEPAYDVVIPCDPSLPCERGNVEAVYEFKFPCPRRTRSRWNRDRRGQAQLKAYDELLKPNRPPVIIRF